MKTAAKAINRKGDKMYLFLLILFEILLVILSYANFKDLLSPTFDMAVMFLLATVLMLPYLQTWEVEFSFETSILIISGLYFMYIIEWIVVRASRHSRKSSVKKSSMFVWQKVNRLARCYQVLACLVQIVTLLLLWSEVRRIGSLWGTCRSVYDLLHTYRIITVNGIAHVNFITSQFMKISIVLGYCSLFWGIDEFIHQGRSRSLLKNFYYVFSVLLLVVQFLLNSTRGPIINYAVFGIVVFCVKYQQQNSWETHINSKIIRVIIKMALIILIVFSASRFLIGRDTSETPIDNLARYFSGSLQLFNLYVQDPIDRSVYWGQETFTGVLQLLYKLGVLDEYISVALEHRNLGSYTGNVYTIFRRPLQDFGYIGMLVFVGVVIFAFAYVYYFKIKYSKSTYRNDLQLFYYAYFYHWIINGVVETYSFNLSSATVIMLFLMAFIFRVFKKVQIRIW